ncbi:MAG: ATP-binding protein [Thermoplasmata archaeon]|nr:ATP-binding protein [Thermoplasmata archaeon]
MDHVQETMDIIGRERELDILAQCSGKGKAVLVYGRRRIGKTTLLEEHCKDRDSIYLTCLDTTVATNLRMMCGTLAEYASADAGEHPGFEDLSRLLAMTLGKGSVTVVIDEYQYLIRKDREADSWMQIVIDRTLKRTDSTLILCGSTIGTMRGLAEDGRGPLFGRFSRIINLGPLSLEDTRGMHPGMPGEDLLQLYLAIGGIPRYHIEMRGRSFEEFVRLECIESRWVEEEASFMVMSEYKSPYKVEAVLTSIACGRTRLKDIASASGLDEPECLKILRELESNGAVGRRTGMLSSPKRPEYLILDPLLSFCHGFLIPKGSMLRMRDGSRAYDELTPHIRTYLGKRFELFCRDYIADNYAVTEMGSWWMDDAKNDVHEDIDIVARVSEGRNTVGILGECKFTSNPAGFHEYNALARRSARFDPSANNRLMILSVSGFDEEFSEFAAETGVILIGPEELYGGAPAPRLSRGGSPTTVWHMPFPQVSRVSIVIIRARVIFINRLHLTNPR